MSNATPLVPPPSPSTIALAGRRTLTLVAELGRGSEATTYRALLESDSFVRRAVAVRVFEGLTANEECDPTIAALARAAQRAACVRHPNVVDTYEFTLLETKQPILVRELVEGMSLAALIERHARAGRRLPLDLSLFIATEVAEALHGARTSTTPEGMLLCVPHLDLSSREVLLSWHGEVKVADFGVGHATRFGSSVRSLRAVARRAATMAPEIVRGRAGDTRSDVFSLGILLREMLVGPRFAPMPEAQALEHARDGYVPPTFLELQLPKEVRAILARALEIDPTRRFPHATALAYELRRVALSMGVGDGRMFLRHALAQERSESTAPTMIVPDEPTQEIEIDTSGGRAERTSGLIRKAPKRESGTDE